MIVNRAIDKEYDCLWTSGYTTVHKKIYRDHFANNWMDYLDIENEKIFYVEFMGIDTFKIFKLEQYVDAEYIDQIRNGDLKLMLHLTGHGYHEIIEEIYTHVVGRDRVPVKNIIVSSESIDLHRAVEWVCKKYNYEPLRTRVTFEFEAYGKHYANTMVNYLDGGRTDAVYVSPFKFEHKKYNKKFICLNGYWREHRAAIVFLLASYNLLDQGYISYNIKYCNGECTGENTYQLLTHRMGHIPEVVELFEQNKEKLCTIDHILLDTEYDQNYQNLAQIKHEHNIWFNDSYFTLCTETNYPNLYPKDFVFEPHRYYDVVGRLYSEKIFRCIVYKHPFIATGPKHFLKVLHLLGYKTFHPIIDESYDNEPDDATRLLMIAKEAKRLCELDEEGLKRFLDYSKEICEHNFNVLKNHRHKFAFDLPLANL
jgi:hypothetical protein